MFEQAYHVCRRIVRQAGSNFYYGMRLLPPAKRLGMYAVYAWSRLCDDAVDEYSGADAQVHLEAAARVFERAYSDGFAGDRNPIVQALGDTVRRFNLPRDPFIGLMEGMAMDIEPQMFATFDDLLPYCQKVAGTIGQLCVGIFGYDDPSACEIANDMGVALQLTNIVRDVKEDADRGRVYLPQSELQAAGYSVDDLRSHMHNAAFVALMREQCARAQSYYDRATGLFGLIEPDARLCARVLLSIYHELLVRIEKRGYDVFSERIRVSTPRKLRLVGTLLWQREIG
jgi:phytoene synthase